MLSYIHIPYCARICPYCGFYKHTFKAAAVGDFVDALIMEAQARISKLETAPRTLYLGGGTPSVLSPYLFEKLMRGLQGVLSFEKVEEITAEANPDTFDLAKAKLWRELGVTRVSLGIQSFDAELLDVLGRSHTPAQAVQAVEILRQAEIPQINIDLMFALPKQSTASWERTLISALSCKVEHISAYNLTYEEDTDFLRRFGGGKTHNDNAEMFFLAHEMLTAANYAHYEISNYARAGAESVHNRGYWCGEDYLGLGPGAVSTLARRRTCNIADTAKYVEKITQGQDAAESSEYLDDAAMRLERLALGLRVNTGVELSLLRAESRAYLDELLALNYAVLKENRIVLTPQGMAVADEIAAELA